MTCLILRAAISGRLIASLPPVSLIAIVWLRNEAAGDCSPVAGHARAALGFVVPSLLAAGGVTILLYGLALWLAASPGITFR